MTSAASATPSVGTLAGTELITPRKLAVRYDQPMLVLYYVAKDNGKTRRRKMPIRNLNLGVEAVVRDLVRRHEKFLKSVKSRQLEHLVTEICHHARHVNTGISLSLSSSLPRSRTPPPAPTPLTTPPAPAPSPPPPIPLPSTPAQLSTLQPPSSLSSLAGLPPLTAPKSLPPLSPMGQLAAAGSPASSSAISPVGDTSATTAPVFAPSPDIANVAREENKNANAELANKIIAVAEPEQVEDDYSDDFGAGETDSDAEIGNNDDGEGEDIVFSDDGLSFDEHSDVDAGDDAF
ncbi:Centrosomal protein of 19 kDa [Borealophlyctis nickersoniae]|nr:Centrosomal protein of 19 kDa [Borealophlyctis nickersoniae]